MKRLALILAASATIVSAAAPSSFASSRGRGVSDAQPAVTYTTGYLRDGNGAGDAASLPVGWPRNVPTPLYGVGVHAGAWRWNLTDLGPVPPGEFTYAPLQNALKNDLAHIWIFYLHADTSMCMANDNGGAFSEGCTHTARDIWAYDPHSGYWVNVGRSNDKGNWEILCNPGGGAALTVGTRDSCTDYHKEWKFKQG
jgi:hypothetical protein